MNGLNQAEEWKSLGGILLFWNTQPVKTVCHLPAGFPEPSEALKKGIRKFWNPKTHQSPGELKHGTGTYKSLCWKDSRMFCCCSVIMVRFVVEIFFCPDESVIFGWFLCVYKHWYLFVRKSLHLFRPPPFFSVVNENMALHLVSKEERRLPIRQQVQIVKQLHHWQFWHGVNDYFFWIFLRFPEGKTCK